ncbi:hypothetical protein AB0F88_40375 [Streptosporangium sp. NPDC023963]|uniref:hypothetical protein n=1 Tax=Streptosporangium sp. NPDC023963 TaxID=3155608 RepID=UPI00343517ED
MSTPSSRPEWSGDQLNRPEMMEAWTAQLRRVLSEHADYVARTRRDAEAMWKANPPEGYGTFEAWWRHIWVTGPFAEIQDHIEKAAKLTFALEARYRRGRHEIPAKRQAAAQARQAPALTHRTESTGRPAQSRLAEPRAPAPEVGFMDMIHKDRGDRRKRSA